jgi:hypothetical protein
MVVREGSDCGKLRDSSILVVGRFKLSEIANIDQTPLTWEFQKGKTYSRRSKKTVLLKGRKSGWDKR